MAFISDTMLSGREQKRKKKKNVSEFHQGKLVLTLAVCVCLREHKTLYLLGVGQDRYNVLYACINSTFFDWDLKALFQTACLQNTTQ